MSANLVNALLHWGQVRGQDTAVRFVLNSEDYDQLSYEELSDRVMRLASYLNKNLAPGGRVLLLFKPGFDYVVSFLACLASGLIAVPAFPPNGNRDWKRLSSLALDCGAGIVFTNEELMEDVEQWMSSNNALNAKLMAMPTLLDGEMAIVQQPVATSEIAFLQYTSGSTGSPKGVMVSHENLFINSTVINKSVALREKNEMVCWLPPYHDMGLIAGIIAPLVGGYPTTLISPATFLRRPTLWLKTIQKFRANITGAPNFAYDLCVNRVTEKDLAELDLSSLQVAACGGEPIQPATLRRFERQFQPVGVNDLTLVPCYGLAETTLMITCSEADRGRRELEVCSDSLAQDQYVAKDNALSPRVQSLVSSGYAVSDTRILIVNGETNEVLEDGDIGQVWVKSPCVAKGYWQKEEASQQAFDNWAIERGNKDGPFLNTGDLGFKIDGDIYITGRAKEVIIVNGRNYYPQDIEKVAQSIDSAIRLDFGAAFSILSESSEQAILVQEISRKILNSENSITRLDSLCQSIVEQTQLTLGLTLKKIIFIKQGSLPKTSSGKIKRSEVKGKFINDIRDNWVFEYGADDSSLSGGLAAVNNGAQSSPDIHLDNDVSFSPSQGDLNDFITNHIASLVNVKNEDIRFNEPLSALGVDSLKALELIEKLEVYTGLKLPETLLYKCSNINELISHIEEMRTSETTSSEPGVKQEALVACEFENHNREELLDLLKKELRDNTV
ncbi:AMP-binding protein [Ketobacter sp.]